MSDKVWYLGKGKKKIGPMSKSRVKKRMAEGRIPTGALAWKDGMESWMPVAEIPELFEDSAVAEPDSGSDVALASSGSTATLKQKKKKKKRKKRTKRSGKPSDDAVVLPESAPEPPAPKKKKKSRARKESKAEAPTEDAPKSEATAKPEDAEAPAPSGAPQGVVPKAILATLGITVVSVAACLGLVAAEVITLENAGAIGAGALVMGLVGLIWGGMQAFKAGRLAKTPFVKTGEAADEEDAHAGAKGAISAEGRVECPELLTSPVTGTPCLYYEVKVVGRWKEDDSTKSEEYESFKEAAAFGINDGTGAVQVDANEGGDIEPLEKTFDETKKEGFLASVAGVGQKMEFGDYEFQNPTGSKADEFTCTERVLLPQDSLFVLGKAEGGVIGSPAWTSLIISNKTRDALLGSTQKAARRFLTGGSVVTAIGALLGIVSAFLG